MNRSLESDESDLTVNCSRFALVVMATEHVPLASVVHAAVFPRLQIPFTVAPETSAPALSRAVTVTVAVQFRPVETAELSRSATCIVPIVTGDGEKAAK